MWLPWELLELDTLDAAVEAADEATDPTLSATTGAGGCCLVSLLLHAVNRQDSSRLPA